MLRPGDVFSSLMLAVARGGACLSLFATLASGLHAATLEEEIATSRQMAREFGEAARKWGVFAAGTAYNEVRISEFECAILGRLIHRRELVEALGKISMPESLEINSSEDAHDFLEVSIQLENWAFTAERLSALSEPEQAVIWNLNCTGRLGIPGSATVASEGVHFRIEGSTLHIIGDIGAGFSRKLQAHLDENPEIEAVALAAYGRDAEEALRAGRLIRSEGLNTTLYANCISACPFVFMGGTTFRVIWSPYPRIGFRGSNFYGTGWEVEAVKSYVEEMGIESSFVLNELRNEEGIRFPELITLCRTGIATSVQRVC